MVIPFESLEARVHRLDTLRRRTFLNQVRARHEDWIAGKIPLATLSRDIGNALEGYAATTIDAMLHGLRPTDLPTPSVLDRYYESITALGASMRDTVTDPSARHAVAQVLQERILRAEMRLRERLAARSTNRRGEHQPSSDNATWSSRRRAVTGRS